MHQVYGVALKWPCDIACYSRGCILLPSYLAAWMLQQHFTTHSAKTNLQDHARLCKNFACKTCLARARNMHDSCTILHIYLARNGKDFARDIYAARIIVPASLEFLAHFFARSALQELVQDCARIVQEKGLIACTCQASLACKILAQSCMIL